MDAEPAREARAVARKPPAHVIADKSCSYYAVGNHYAAQEVGTLFHRAVRQAAVPIGLFGPTRSSRPIGADP